MGPPRRDATVNLLHSLKTPSTALESQIIIWPDRTRHRPNNQNSCWRASAPLRIFNKRRKSVIGWSYYKFTPLSRTGKRDRIPITKISIWETVAYLSRNDYWHRTRETKNEHGSSYYGLFFVRNSIGDHLFVYRFVQRFSHFFLYPPLLPLSFLSFFSFFLFLIYHYAVSFITMQLDLWRNFFRGPTKYNDETDVIIFFLSTSDFFLSLVRLLFVSIYNSFKLWKFKSKCKSNLFICF